MKYSIDTSAFLHAFVRNYPPDIFPSLWNHIECAIENEIICATEEVFVELEKKDDDAFRWAANHRSMFIDIDEVIQEEVIRILDTFPRLVDTRKHRSSADPFVIALASILRCTVVTEEQQTGNSIKPKIPDVCNKLGIRCIKTLDMIREQRWIS